MSEPFFDTEIQAPIGTPIERDLAIGQHVYSAWRRRLAKAQRFIPNNAYGYVAGQMRKSGLPLVLARCILLDVTP